MTIVIGILLFSLLVFLHELGHFVAARLSGVQVNEFAIFMGPALVKWQWGETQYSIRCIPFGGYCAMEGEDEDTENPRSFQKAAWWKRLIILVAGSAMNLVTGFVLMALLTAPAQNITVPVIHEVKPGCTVVREDGLHIGDRILQVDGEHIYTAGNVSMILSLNSGDVHDFVVERDGQKVYLDDFLMEKHLFEGEETPRFGFDFKVVPATFGNKLAYAWNSSINVIRTTRLSLQMLFNGQAGVMDLTGPVGIVQMMSETAEASETALEMTMNFLNFGAFIAINLGVMNLLPIPAVDGGRVFGLLVTTVVEAVTKKKINPKYEGYIHGAGLVLLLALMVFILGKDILMLFKG